MLGRWEEGASSDKGPKDEVQSVYGRVYKVPSLQDYCCRTTHKGKVQMQPHLQMPTLAPRRNTQKTAKRHKDQLEKNPLKLAVNIWSDLVILSK